jgi:N-acetylglucosamine-6-phosphate deacetylase
MNCKGQNAFSGESIELEFDRAVTSVDPVLGQPAPEAYVAPGFIDLQVNGFAGVDYNSPTTPVEDIAASIRVLHSTGVTAFFPTVITGPPEAMIGAIRNLARAKQELGEAAASSGGSIAGFHIEGPHISPEDGPRGAHPAQWVRPPDLDEFQRWQDAAQGEVRLVTLSPEWPGAASYIDRLSREGVAVSIGHTKATRQQIQDAVRAGATLSTHLGNGAHATLPRHPNYIWEQLAEDRLAASFIVDGHHLPGSFVKVALRAKGIERSILVTDAVAPATCPPGDYQLGEVAIELQEDGRVTIRGGERLAGSSLRMDHAIGNVMRIAGVTLAEAVTMATRNPARVGRIGARMRGLEPGARADLVRFMLEDGRVRVLETFVNGQRVFSIAG